jgi:hypothetical protein
VYGVNHEDLILAVTVGPDPLAALSLDEREQLVCGGAHEEIRDSGLIDRCCRPGAQGDVGRGGGGLVAEGDPVHTPQSKQYCGGAGDGGSTSLAQIVPASHSKVRIEPRTRTMLKRMLRLTLCLHLRLPRVLPLAAPRSAARQAGRARVRGAVGRPLLLSSSTIREAVGGWWEQARCSMRFPVPLVALEQRLFGSLSPAPVRRASSCVH